MHVVVIFIILVVAAVAGYLVYYSVQSLKQAAVLSNPLPLSMLKDRLDTPVAVHGRPELAAGQSGPIGFPVLWYKRQDQEYRRSGKHGGWRTLNTTFKTYDFYVHFPDGGRVVVSGAPTEVHGSQTRTDGGGFFAHHGMRRTIHTWLSVRPALTVMGMLALMDSGATVTPCKSLGMVFTTSEPGKAAFVERMKGVSGLIASAVMAAGAVAIIAIMAS